MGSFPVLMRRMGKNTTVGRGSKEWEMYLLHQSVLKTEFISLVKKAPCMVIKHGPVFKALAKNKLDDNFSASPAIVGNTLYLRGYKNLYCIEEKD